MVKIETPLTTLPEVEKTLLESTERNTKLTYNGVKLFFTKEERNGNTYYIQRLENDMYGHVFHNGIWISSYPHLSNIKDGTKLTLEKCVFEEKLNGTNVGIGKYGIRTRMNPFPVEFPVPTFWNSTINGMINKDLSKKLLTMRNEMLNRYPEWYIVAGDGEYVGLKVCEVVKHILDVDRMQKYGDFGFMFFFELIGKINPIIIDSDIEFGFYDFDYKMVLIDVSRDGKFVSREMKERIADDMGFEIVPVRFRFDTIDELRNSIPMIKNEAAVHKIEGYVLKNGSEMVKVKPDVILESAYRLNSILKGYIYLPDLLNYISKVVSADSLSRPEEYDSLIEMIAEEAKADYSEDIVSKNKNQIRKHVAESMAILVADKIIKEITFRTKDEMFRYLNIEIPKRFEPLKSYIDYELEKTTEDKELKEKMKRRRVRIFGKVAEYCMKHTEFCKCKR